MKGYNGFTPYQRQQHHDWLKLVLGMGVVPKPTACAACGQTEGKIEYHAEDYNWRFTPGIALCYRCHTVVHLRDRYPEFWDAYRGAVREGCRFEPANNFNEVLQHARNGNLDFAYFDVVEFSLLRANTVLDDIQDGRLKPAVINKPPRNWRQLIESELGRKP